MFSKAWLIFGKEMKMMVRDRRLTISVIIISLVVMPFLMGFIGNIEGRDILAGTVKVVVTDGFTGNVALKLMEGTAAFMLDQVRSAVMSSLMGRIGGLLVRPSLRKMREETHPDTYGGAYLLGVRGISVIGHGNGRARAVANALQLAAKGARNDLVSRLAEGIDAEKGPLVETQG